MGKSEPLRTAILRCEICGTEVDIQRRASRRKKSGHTKHLYCFSCGEKTAHVEVDAA